MRIKFMHRNAVNCEVVTGTVHNKRILNPHINLTYSETILPFNLQITQSPIIPCTWDDNKSQGQTFKKIGIYLNRPDLYSSISQQVEFDHYTV